MTVTEPPASFERLLSKISRERGMSCGAYKPRCLKRRIAVRMRAHGVERYEEYARILDGDPEEYQRLVDTITINVTKFYRNPDTWDALAQRFLPSLMSKRFGVMRCWSAGCASGEEPYTMALILADVARRGGFQARFRRTRIDATDLDVTVLERAREAAYPARVFEDLPGRLFRQYLSPDAPHIVDQALRDVVHFIQHDLTTEPPPAPSYDLIVCRNVLIYFDRPTQEQLFTTFVDAYNRILRRLTS